MKVDTIDFSDIQTDISEDLLNLKFDYDQDREIRSRLFAQYWDQKRLSNDLFSDWLAQTNADLIKDVDNFVRHSLRIDGQKYLFQESHSNLIHPATVILGMQATDHGPTLDLIEEHIRKEHPSIRTLRVESGLSKRSQVLEIFARTYRDKNLLVIIEQTEIIDKRLLEILVSGLYERLCGQILDHIMIMFCMSGSWKPINHLFPISIMNRMKKNTTIVKDTSIVFNDIQRRLLENEMLTFKLDPDLMRLIDDEFLERDASIINIKYLYQCALFEHHTDRTSLLTLPRQDLVNIFKAHPRLFSELKNLSSLSKQKKNIHHMNPAAFASFCTEQIDKIQNYHRFLLNQLSDYFILLRDETREKFPSNLLDIYQTLFDCDDLANSPEFVDAIGKLSKFSVEGLKRRLLKIGESRSGPPHYESDKDVTNILADFLKKLENNDDGNDIIMELVNKLLRHAQSMKNPLGPLNEAIYHYKCKRVRARTVPASAYYAKSDYISTTSDFGILYQMIHVDHEEMNMNILFGDFKDNFSSLKRKREVICSSNVSPIKAQKTKSRKTKLTLELAETEDAQSSETFVEEGLMRAIFVDLIDCMEFQGLIKLDKRRSNKGILRKCVWL